MKKITVIGAGGTGHTLVADLTRRGFDVSFCEEPEHVGTLSAVQAAGGIEIAGALSPGFVPADSVVTEFDTAVADAEIILVSVIANRHAKLARRMQPLLRKDQSIVIGPDNGGSLVFAREFRTLGMTHDVLLGGMGGNYYPCRLIGPARVFVGMPTGPKRIAAFPAANTEELIASLEGIFDFTAATNVLEMALSTPNIPNHLAGAILNAGAIEASSGKFNLFRDGLSPAVLKCIDAIVAERNAILKALGYAEINSPMLRKVAQLDQHPELDMFRDLDGPPDMQHRYVSEDAEIGISLLVSLGKLLGIETPVARSLLEIASAINDINYYSIGRTTGALEIEFNTIGEMNHYLETGSNESMVLIPPLI